MAFYSIYFCFLIYLLLQVGGQRINYRKSANRKTDADKEYIDLRLKGLIETTEEEEEVESGLDEENNLFLVKTSSNTSVND